MPWFWYLEVMLLQSKSISLSEYFATILNAIMNTFSLLQSNEKHTDVMSTVYTLSPAMAASVSVIYASVIFGIFACPVPVNIDLDCFMCLTF